MSKGYLYLRPTILLVGMVMMTMVVTGVVGKSEEKCQTLCPCMHQNSVPPPPSLIPRPCPCEQIVACSNNQGQMPMAAPSQPPQVPIQILPIAIPTPPAPAPPAAPSGTPAKTEPSSSSESSSSAAPPPPTPTRPSGHTIYIMNTNINNVDHDSESSSQAGPRDDLPSNSPGGSPVVLRIQNPIVFTIWK